jgi:hypothetical protein
MAGSCRSSGRRFFMRLILGTLVLLALVGCSSTVPPAVRVGEICFSCRQPVADARLAGRIMTGSGNTFVFRTVGCMVRQFVQHDSRAQVFVTDYESGRLLPARHATFVRHQIGPKAGDTDFVAFRSGEEAKRFAAPSGERLVDWDELLLRARGVARGH